MQKKGSKNFWNKRKVVRSGLEERIKEDLEKRKVDFGYETIKLKYTKSVCQHCGEPVSTGVYTPDFIIKRDSGIRLIVESKGRFTGSDRTKMLNVKRDNPTEDIRFVFQRDQFLRAGSKTRYSEWALKKGFICVVGESVPADWIKETEQETMEMIRSVSAIQRQSSKTSLEKKEKMR